MTFQHFARSSDQKMGTEEFTKLVGQVANRGQGYKLSRELIENMYNLIDSKKDKVIDL